jgi:hypothetical protein
MEKFYERIPAFTVFNDFTLDHNFRDVPWDWSVIITDIRGSTKAIADGRYKEVNTIGAASIVVVRKAMGKMDFPFVFGGDGTTMLVPNSNIQAVKEKLCALKALALKNYQLELRVGIIGIKDLSAEEKKIQVGKYEITPGKSIAILRGDGITHAEKLIKGSDKYEVKEDPSHEVDLSGLSCRWNPIPSRKGKILTVLMSSRNGDRVYLDFISALTKILPEGIEGSNPVNDEIATYKKIGKLLAEEARLHSSLLAPKFFARALEIIYAVMVFKYKFPAIFFDPGKYTQSMRTHSDFRKFDDMLRMVLDCTLDQISQIEAYLKSKHHEGDLFYGTFQTDSSLMTCFVEGLGQGEHIHFIDAENGGYATAAVELKKQMKSAQ